MPVYEFEVQIRVRKRIAALDGRAAKNLCGGAISDMVNRADFELVRVKYVTPAIIKRE